MSSETPASHPIRKMDPKLGLIFALADQLIPLFKANAPDIHAARRMAVSAMDAYRPETRADYVNAARAIALSMASLALLGSAASQELPMNEKMRILGRANALNRSADQTERSMIQRRRYYLANPPREELDYDQPVSEPSAANSVAFSPEEEAAIVEAVNEYLESRSAAQTAQPDAPPAKPIAVAPVGKVHPHAIAMPRTSPMMNAAAASRSNAADSHGMASRAP